MYRTTQSYIVNYFSTTNDHEYPKTGLANCLVIGPKYANNVTHSLEEYRRLFKKAKPGQLCGDISPDYLYYYQNAVPKILNEKDAQVPIIVVLRNPIDRAYSSYLYHVRDSHILRARAVCFTPQSVFLKCLSIFFIRFSSCWCLIAPTNGRTWTAGA